MVIYEVNITIPADIKIKYLTWLKAHIQEMLNFDGFKKAYLQEEQTDQSQTCLTINYVIESEEYLNQYFNTQAPRMRQDGIEKFGDKMTATRRIFSNFESFSAA